jgi:hypothetical protein
MFASRRSIGLFVWSYFFERNPMFSISDSFNHVIFENPYFMEKLVGFYTELLSLNYAIESIKKNWN